MKESIIYLPQFELSLLEYGIQIPLLDQRAKKCAEILKITPYSGPLLEINKKDMRRVHTNEYTAELFCDDSLGAKMIEAYELMNQDGSLNRYDPDMALKNFSQLFDSVRGQVAGTYLALKLAIDKKAWSYYLGGGMHHAHSTRGSGFCLIHDGLIALRKLQFEKIIKRAWIIDLDAHKGDGTASITSGDPSILSLSIHMKNSWPLNQKKKKGQAPWWIKSTVDIELAQNEEHLYLDKLEKGLKKLEKISLKIGPPDVVWVIDGADAYEQDILPSTTHLKLNQFEMLQRGALVATFLYERGWPSSWVMGGGYGPDVYKIHVQSILFLKALFSQR